MENQSQEMRVEVISPEPDNSLVGWEYPNGFSVTTLEPEESNSSPPQESS